MYKRQLKTLLKFLYYNVHFLLTIYIGENYLDDIVTSSKGKSKEVIIAIENNDLNELL